MSARHGTAHPNPADVNKTGATLADRSRVSILLQLQVKAGRLAPTGLCAGALLALLPQTSAMSNVA
ncbi:hypothetical protein DB811_14690 [Xanthomonas perforans]|uniref:Uncharacterized protein n=1 Tax=Xanthomonas perforans TaxID=442694 RepID=A0AAQ0YR15_XANPE|nr:hypothetical protein BJD11_02765 [Xanthomonas euvesicatoria]APP01009.1 hypothetical protein BJD13_19675 [Xanthomonas perforans]AQS77427.1 hypothetical protein XPE_15305 [Xanthomonas perforans 91-118]PWH24286.1 hypothetical protein CDO09_08175 [Xanthomonas perforans]PWH27327.1 hypothetical protein CEX93_11465 [Xanthomonas euvesicatoria]